MGWITVQARFTREVRAAMPQRFVLRSNWIVQGIRVDKATKQKLEASVYSRDKFMGLQEYGGPKHPHGNNLAVPTSLVRRSPKDRIRRSETPKALGDRVEVVQVGGRKFLALKKRRKGAGKNMLRLMYLLIPRAQLQERKKALINEVNGYRSSISNFIAPK